MVAVLACLVAGLTLVSATLQVSQKETTITLANDRLTAVLQKSAGQVVDLFLDGQDLLGPRSGSTGIGPYLDCYCIPSGFYTAGATSPTMEVVQGADSTGINHAGMILTDTYTPTGQQFQQYWFLRDGETGLHMFSRLSYYNETTLFLRNLQELRTLFRLNTLLWTHLTSSEFQTAPLPSKAAIAKEIIVQDATWTFNNTPSHAYYTQFSNYFTKYTFSNPWRNNSVHGLYADGSTSSGTTYGAWLVLNTKDTYYGGPIHADLTVDGIVYNYLVSNHHGEGTPNITNGFDRTFGPQYYFFNGGKGSASLEDLRAEAKALATPEWNSAFHNSIAKHVVGYVPSSHRGTVQGKLNLPKSAVPPIAILTADRVYFQDNSAVSNSYQYRVDINSDGSFTIDRVKEGKYRLTVYAKGILGDFVQDSITGAYDWTADFPEGVNHTIGTRDPAVDFNTVHWSVFGPTFSDSHVEYDTTHDWNIYFSMSAKQLRQTETATLTIQLAGAKTAAGNTDSYINDQPDPLTLVIGFNQSSSCIVRSAVSCYQISSRMSFPAKWLHEGDNVLRLHLPYNATDVATAVLPGTVYVQYDALRLEVK